MVTALKWFVVALGVVVLLLSLIAAIAVTVAMVAAALRSRGEESGVDDDGSVPGCDCEDCDGDRTRTELARRWFLIAEEMPDLASLPRQLEDLYLIEVPRG